MLMISACTFHSLCKFYGSFYKPHSHSIDAVLVMKLSLAIDLYGDGRYVVVGDRVLAPALNVLLIVL